LGRGATPGTQHQKFKERETMPFQRLRTSVLHPLTFGALFVGLSATAFADNGYLPAGSGVCSQQVQATGVYFSGGVAPIPGPATWTVQEQSTPTGPATQIYTATLQTSAGITVMPPVAGTYYFRVCVTNPGTKPMYYSYDVAGPHGAVAPLTGANTAVLAPQGGACAQFATGPAQRLGASNVPVLWYMQQFDGCGDNLGSNQTVTAASVNDTVQLNASEGAFEMELCVSNTSTSTATLTFQLIPAD
jgi:hypothetical protein